MAASTGKKQLLNAEGEYAKLQGKLQATSGYGEARTDDEELDMARHDRAHNPLEMAERGLVCDKLNQDAGRYRKGPGPM